MFVNIIENVLNTMFYSMYNSILLLIVNVTSEGALSQIFIAK